MRSPASISTSTWTADPYGRTLHFGIREHAMGSILSGMPLVTKPKARHNAEDDYVFATMACAVPQFRVDYNGQMPVAHTTT